MGLRGKRAELTIVVSRADKARDGHRTSPRKSGNEDNFFAGVAPLGQAFEAQVNLDNNFAAANFPLSITRVFSTMIGGLSNLAQSVLMVSLNCCSNSSLLITG